MFGEVFGVLFQVILFVIAALASAVLWIAGWYIASCFSTDPTSSGAYFAAGLLTSPIAMIVGGLLSLLIKVK